MTENIFSVSSVAIVSCLTEVFPGLCCVERNIVKCIKNIEREREKHFTNGI
jgi:hypothetical protein